MTDAALRRMLLEAAGRLFEEAPEDEIQDAADRGELVSPLWDGIEDNGLLDALLPAEQGGVGTEAALALLRVAGAYAVPVPVLETMVARHVLTAAGCELPAGPLSFAVLGASSSRRLRFAWPEHARRVLVGDGKVRVYGFAEPVPLQLDGEPSAFGRPGGVPELEADLPEPLDADRVLLVAAAGRTQMIAGAMERVLDLVLEHVRGRSQFGRPIAKFQAVQQLVARLAAEAAIVGVAADAAAQSLEDSRAWIPVAAAKARASEAVSEVSRIAHQLHGAIGYTREHALHRFTRRLWVWRDDFGDELYWQERVGAAAIAAGRDGLWADVLTA